jgi:6-phosphogluconolactonase (cycloisomerase 2 family)
VVTYATDARTGLLTAAAWTPTQGRVPRFITLDRAGRFLYAANEQGDSIVAFRVDRKTGRLETTGATVKMATPVTIVFTAP